MKKVFALIILSALAWGCNQESDVSPASEKTFIRYFGSQFSHTANLALEADNGYSLLGTIEIPTNNLGAFAYKIRFIHTDLNGNTVWQKEYPSGTVFNQNDVGGYRASSFVTLPGSGYLIIGDSINSDGSSKLQLLQIDLAGNLVNQKVIGKKSNTDGQNPSLYGRALTLDPSGDILLLGNMTGLKNEDMYVARLRSDFTPVWSREYGDGISSITSRLFLNSDQNLVWAASTAFTNSNLTNDFRVIITPQDSEGVNSGSNLINATYDETCADITGTSSGFIYVLIGSTNEQAEGGTGPSNIYLTRVYKDGSEIPLSRRIFDFSGQNDQGNSICIADDGGLVILGTVESTTTKGNGRKDCYIMKTDAAGEKKQWEKNYGGLDNEEGASIRPTSDGSYLVFGTTSFGSLKKLMLMKVNSNGEL